MIFRHENDLRLLEFAYLCKREVKWTLLQTFERLEIPHEYLNGTQDVLAKILFVPFKYLKCCQ